MKTIGFIGAGNMATALASAFKSQYSDLNIIFSEPFDTNADNFCNKIQGSIREKDNHCVSTKSDIIVLAVKPQIINSVLEEIVSYDRVVISIAAGIKLSTLSKKIPRASIVRVMPNAPCLVGKMAAGLSFDSNFQQIDRKYVFDLLSSAGEVIEITEDKMDAVTGLSGSGPAFVARLIEAFIIAGVEEGLSEEASRVLAIQTFEGTAVLLKEMKLTCEQLVDMVSSPNGTTVAGRAVLESSDYREIITKTVSAASSRSKELAHGK